MTKVNVCDIETLMATQHVQEFVKVLGPDFGENERKFWTPLLEKQPDISENAKSLTIGNPEVKWAFCYLTDEDINNLGGNADGGMILGFTTVTPKDDVVVIIYMTQGIPENTLYDTIRHEMVHADQFFTGRLKFTDRTTVLFDDKEYVATPLDFIKSKSTGEYMTKVIAYISQPWEAEAFYESGLSALMPEELANIMWAHYDEKGSWLPELPADFWYTLEKGEYKNRFEHAAAIIRSMW